MFVCIPACVALGLHSDRKGEEGADWAADWTREAGGQGCRCPGPSPCPPRCCHAGEPAETVTWERGGQRNGLQMSLPTHSLVLFVFESKVELRIGKGKNGGSG